MNVEVIEIVRYANRKLYCKNLGRYVNLAEIVEMIQSGKEVDVTCMVTHSDYLIPILATYLKLVYEDEILEMKKEDVIETVKKKITRPPKKYISWTENAVRKSNQRSWEKAAQKTL